MEPAERDKRVLEILARKDAIRAERDEIVSKLEALDTEERKLLAEAQQLFGATTASQGRVMTCGKCGEKGHNARSCPNPKKEK